MSAGGFEHFGSAALSGRLAPGTRIAGYIVGRRVGKGGMAEVYLAQDERLGRMVALKVLAPTVAADEAYRERFLRESRAAAAVDHPHILPVYEAGESGGELFIAMRFVAGGDVRSLVSAAKRLSPARAAGLVSPVASALDAAHLMGLVHRDVKPDNMLLDVQPGLRDHIYLSDFGLAKQSEATSGPTATGQFVGTADYCAPEQLEARALDGAADQYSLACVTFELLTGAPPFRKDKLTALMYAHLSEAPPRITSLRPELPARLDAVLTRALAKEPGHRYGTCGEFAEALRSALGLRPLDATQESTPVPQATQVITEAAVAMADTRTVASVPVTYVPPARPTSPLVHPPTPSGPIAPTPVPQPRPSRPSVWRRIAPILATAAALAVIGALVFVLSQMHPVTKNRWQSLPSGTWREFGIAQMTQEPGNIIRVLGGSRGWAGLISSKAPKCPYEIQMEARAINLVGHIGYGYGIASGSLNASGIPYAVAFQYDFGFHGYRALTYPYDGSRPLHLVLAQLDYGWHQVTIIFGQTTTAFIDSKQVITYRGAAHCGMPMIRVWASAAEFRDIRIREI